MKAIEKKTLENLLAKLNKEVECAEKETEKASKKVAETDYNKDAYSYYQQRYEYLNGTMMVRTIVIAELRKLGIQAQDR